MGRTLGYTVAHLEIDGDIIDRERGYPELELAMEPMGRALTPEQQTRQLRVKIGSKITIINAEGVDELVTWLLENGAARKIPIPIPTNQTREHHIFQPHVGPDNQIICGWFMADDLGKCQKQATDPVHDYDF